MTDAFITQCPHCQSSFRIKRSQLDATQETVRCGACLQEYNAASQFNNSTIKQITAASPADHFSYFSDEPIRLGWQPKQKKPWQPWHMWSLLNVVAVLLLLSQYTYHNFTELARQDSTRPLLAAICPLFGCELPAKVDIEQIKSSNLVIRSHPEFKGALQVDAIIYNRAPFSQPFPLLELTFSDAQGERLMSRKFKAEEYLSGELAGQNNMPQQVPIHIALEILEPSSEIINYSLKFVSPD